MTGAVTGLIFILEISQRIFFTGCTTVLFNPDFAFEIVMRVSNVMQIGVSGYFLPEKIVIYFEVKKCSEILSCAAVESRNRFSTAKSGFKISKTAI